MSKATIVILFLIFSCPDKSMGEKICENWYKAHSLNKEIKLKAMNKDHTRLAAIIRQQAKNILEEDVKENLNITKKGNHFFSKYSTKKNESIEILFSKKAIIHAYKQKNKSGYNYFCLSSISEK